MFPSLQPPTDAAHAAGMGPFERHSVGPNDNPRLDVAVMHAVAQEQQAMMQNCRQLSVAGGCLVSVSVYGPMSEKEANEYNLNISIAAAALGAGISGLTYFMNRIPIIGPLLSSSPNLLRTLEAAGTASGVAAGFAVPLTAESALPGNVAIITLGFTEHRGVRRHLGMNRRFIKPATRWQQRMTEASVQ